MPVKSGSNEQNNLSNIQFEFTERLIWFILQMLFVHFSSTWKMLYCLLLKKRITENPFCLTCDPNRKIITGKNDLLQDNEEPNYRKQAVQPERFRSRVEFCIKVWEVSEAEPFFPPPQGWAGQPRGAASAFPNHSPQPDYRVDCYTISTLHLEFRISNMNTGSRQPYLAWSPMYFLSSPRGTTFALDINCF